MKRIVVITPVDARHGFALSGVLQRTAAPEELLPMLRELAADPLTGVVIVDERLLAGPAGDDIESLERRWPGLVVVLPAPEKAALAEEDYIARLIRQAIGYQVRLSP